MSLSFRYFRMASTSGTNGVSDLRMFFQSIPVKKGWAFISAIPLDPSRTSGSATSLQIRSFISSPFVIIFNSF
jgi:hypothetical protein